MIIEFGSAAGSLTRYPSWSKVNTWTVEELLVPPTLYCSNSWAFFWRWIGYSYLLPWQQWSGHAPTQCLQHSLLEFWSQCTLHGTTQWELLSPIHWRAGKQENLTLCGVGVCIPCIVIHQDSIQQRNLWTAKEIRNSPPFQIWMVYRWIGFETLRWSGTFPSSCSRP